MSVLRAEQFFGKKDPDALFKGHPSTVVPWGQTGGLKGRQLYDKNLVKAVIMHPDRHEMVSIDPRNLRATQPLVTRAGVKHYMENPDREDLWDEGGGPGNTRPIVYHHEAKNANLILGGHHRAASALLRGEQFKAVVVSGGWGAGR